MEELLEDEFKKDLLEAKLRLYSLLLIKSKGALNESEIEIMHQLSKDDTVSKEVSARMKANREFMNSQQ